METDFDEWELLPDTRHTFVNFSLEGEKGLLFSKDIDSDYFSDGKNTGLMEEEEVCKDIVMVPPPLQIPMLVADHRDLAPIVLFKKFKDEKFVNTKIESPNKNAKDPVMPPVEPEQMMLNSEEEEKFYKDEKNSEKEIEYVEPEIKDKQFGLRIWNWRLEGGVGALCSIGVAAATFCIFILGGRQLQKHQNRNQKIRFQIYTDEKRIKEVVQQATRLNHAFTAVRGVPMNRADISFGGYYDGL